MMYTIGKDCSSGDSILGCAQMIESDMVNLWDEMPKDISWDQHLLWQASARSKFSSPTEPMLIGSTRLDRRMRACKPNKQSFLLFAFAFHWPTYHSRVTATTTSS